MPWDDPLILVPFLAMALFISLVGNLPGLFPAYIGGFIIVFNIMLYCLFSCYFFLTVIFLRHKSFEINYFNK